MKKHHVEAASAQILGSLLHVLASPISIVEAVIDTTEGIPLSDEPGVYAILGEDDQVLYIGKSEVAMGSRFWTHVTADPEGDGFRWKFDLPDIEQPRRIAVFPLSERDRLLAPAIEMALIYHFQPPVNVVGRERRD